MIQQSDCQPTVRQLAFFLIAILILFGSGGCRPTPMPTDILVPSPTESPGLPPTETPAPPTIVSATRAPTVEKEIRPVTGEASEIPLGIGIYQAENVAVFNKYAREQDVISARPPFLHLLKDVKVGQKMLNLNPRDEPLTNIGPIIAEGKAIGVTILGYNLEAALSREDLVSKESDMQVVARESGLLYAFGPTLGKLLKYYDDFSKSADIIVFQSQRFQTTKEYEARVEELIERIRAVNPEVKVWVQVSVNPPEKRQATPDEVVNHIQLIADKADLIWIFFAPKKASVMEEVVKRLRQSGGLGGQQSPAYLYGYWCFSRPSDLPLEDLNDYTNVIFFNHDYQNDLPSEEDLQKLRENDLKLILKLDKEVVEKNFDEAALVELRSRLDQYKDVVEAIYPVDEPYRPKRWKRYTEDELEDLIQRIKRVFPDYKTYVNFLHPTDIVAQLGYYPDIPENIDIISIDIYLHSNENMENAYKDHIGRNLDLIKEKAGSRPVFFASRGSNPVDEKDNRLTIHQAEWDYDLFKEYKLMGLGWYFYDDIHPSGKSYGSSHYLEIIKKHKEIGQRILLEASVDASVDDNVIRHPIVFAIEQRTLEKYPDAKTRIELTIEDINKRLSTTGIQREFYIDHFAPEYNKSDITNCKARELSAGYLPEEYCDHPLNMIFVIADETESHNYPSPTFSSVEWHGFKELFSPRGTGVLAHELGNLLGLPDMYRLRVEAEDNSVNHQPFLSPFVGYVMNSMDPGDFHTWDKEILNRENTSLPAANNTWVNYQPENTVLEIVDRAGSPLRGAAIKVYVSSPVSAAKQEIDNDPEYDGQTDMNGRFSLGSNVLGMDPYKAVRVFLVEIKLNGQTDYQWFNFTDVNFAFWNTDDILIESNIRSQS